MNKCDVIRAEQSLAANGVSERIRGKHGIYRVETTDYNNLKWQFEKEIRLPANRVIGFSGGDFYGHFWRWDSYP